MANFIKNLLIKYLSKFRWTFVMYSDEYITKTRVNATLVDQLGPHECDKDRKNIPCIFLSNDQSLVHGQLFVHLPYL